MTQFVVLRRWFIRFEKFYEARCSLVVHIAVFTISRSPFSLTRFDLVATSGVDIRHRLRAEIASSPPRRPRTARRRYGRRRKRRLGSASRFRSRYHPRSDQHQHRAELRMASYTCGQCGMSVNMTCAKCGQELVNDTLTKDDGSTVQVSQCPEGHGKIKSPMCCAVDMTCQV